MNLKLHPFVALSILALAPLPAFALGIRIVDQDARATARGEAFVATADNPSAIYYNPAGITQLDGTQVRIGAYAITLEASVDPTVPGRSLDSKFEYQGVPQLFLTYKAPKSPVAVGFGIYAPFGFGIEYPDNTPFRTLAKKGRIEYLTFNPVLAIEVTKTLSIAAGPTVNHSKAKLTRGIIVPHDEFLFDGEGVGYGFNAGVFWNPHRMHHFGLTYRSETNVDYSGHSRVHIPSFTAATPFGPFPVAQFDSEEDSDLKFHFPQTIAAGYSFQPTPDWNFEVDVEWTDWDSLNTLNLKQHSGNIALPFNWESSFIYEFGVTRKFGRGLSLSAGYIYSENSVPNESFNPIVPDSNRHIFSLGLGQQLDRLSWDVTYQYAHGPNREVNNGTAANGTYHFQSQALTFSVGYRF